MIRAFILSLALVATPAFAQDNHGGHDAEHEGEDHLSEANGVRAVHAWTHATRDHHALVFVEIENTSDAAVTLLGGDAGNAESAALVGFALVDGEPGYVELPGMPVSAGGEVVLSPNGIAIELDGLDEDLHGGESFEMELEFDFGHLDIVVDVEDAGASQHGHAGHQH